MSQRSTPGILQRLELESWRAHYFGLPSRRWEHLRGQSFWITGAGTGFGRSIAVALSAAGARVFLTGRRLGKLEETRAEMNSLGIDQGLCVLVPADIANPASVERASQSIAQHARHLDGLICNAALPEPGGVRWPLAELDETEWSALIATNVTGQWLACRAALPFMTKGDGIRIVFMTSEAGWADTPGFGPYNLSKAAVNSLGYSLAAECEERWPGKDVQINVLVPGEAHTEMNQGSSESPYAVVSMALALLSHPAGGPNGRFFHRDGRHLAFGYAEPYPVSLFEGESNRLIDGAGQKSSSAASLRSRYSRFLNRLWPRA